VAPERAKRGVIQQALAAEDQSVNASLYILLRAVDRFQATCGRFPGALPGYVLLPASPQHSVCRSKHQISMGNMLFLLWVLAGASCVHVGTAILACF